MKRLLLALLPLTAFAAAPVGDWSPNLTTTFAWQNNLSNGEAVWDRFTTLQIGADVLSSKQFQIAPFDAAHVSIHLAGDWIPRFNALDRGLGGVRADWQHTFGRGTIAPVFTFEAAGDGVAAQEKARRGWQNSATLRLAQQIGTAWRVAVSERFEQYSANSTVFDRHGNETAIEISRDINDDTRLVLTGRWRNGDVVTYAQYDRPDLMAIAHASERLTTFHTPMTAYATNADTTAGRLALVHATTEESAIALSYEYARTSRTGLRFANQTIALSFVRQY